jgi:hypothetical protein
MEPTVRELMQRVERLEEAVLPPPEPPPPAPKPDPRRERFRELLAIARGRWNERHRAIYAQADEDHRYRLRMTPDEAGAAGKRRSLWAAEAQVLHLRQTEADKGRLLLIDGEDESILPATEDDKQAKADRELTAELTALAHELGRVSRAI